VIPGECLVQFNFRFSTESPPEALKARVREILDRHGLEYGLQWTLTGLPYLTPRGTLVDALEQAIVAETGITPELSTTGGTSDGRFIAAVADQVVEFGPINLTIHKVNEQIAIESIDRLATIYLGLLERLLLA
jgi:succinyl-diaminopimelate desuccinylase